MKGYADDVRRRRLDVERRLGLGRMILMTLVMVVFWALVITAVVLAVRYLASGGSHHNRVGSGSRQPAAAPKTCWPNATPAVRSTTMNIAGVSR